MRDRRAGQEVSELFGKEVSASGHELDVQVVNVSFVSAQLAGREREVGGSR